MNLQVITKNLPTTQTEESVSKDKSCCSPDLKMRFKMATQPFGVMSGEVKSFSNSMKNKHADIKEMR